MNCIALCGISFLSGCFVFFTADDRFDNLVYFTNYVPRIPRRKSNVESEKFLGLGEENRVANVLHKVRLYAFFQISVELRKSVTGFFCWPTCAVENKFRILIGLVNYLLELTQ